MTKYIFQFIFSLILSTSILAPTVLALIEKGQEKALVLESKEGESNDGEKKYDEKQLFLETVIHFSHAPVTLESLLENPKPLTYQPIDTEILLPPPKGFLI